MLFPTMARRVPWPRVSQAPGAAMNPVPAWKSNGFTLGSQYPPLVALCPPSEVAAPPRQLYPSFDGPLYNLKVRILHRGFGSRIRQPAGMRIRQPAGFVFLVRSISCLGRVAALALTASESAAPRARCRACSCAAGRVEGELMSRRSPRRRGRFPSLLKSLPRL